MTMEQGNALALTSAQRQRLDQLLRCRSTPQQLARRCCIISALSQGFSPREVSQQLMVSRPTVLLWRERFNARGIDGLLDEARSGAPRRISDSEVERVVRTTTQLAMSGGRVPATRAVARECGMSQSAVSRVWRAYQLSRESPAPFRILNRRRDTRHLVDITGCWVGPTASVVVLAGTRNAWQGPRSLQPYDNSDEKSLAGMSTNRGPMLEVMEYHMRTRSGADEQPPASLGSFLKNCASRDGDPSEATQHYVFDRYSVRTAAEVVRWQASVPHVRCHLTESAAQWVLQVNELVGLLLSADHDRPGIRRSAQSLVGAASAFMRTANPPGPFVWLNRLGRDAPGIDATLRALCGETGAPRRWNERSEQAWPASV